ncbi:MAG: penicillin-binding protein 2, partial [Gemmatimonadota bacterium]|nr:penicillin-binding protein 2 [Gemmatimonadota bacterium]
MDRLAPRRRLLFAAISAAALLVVGRAVQLQAFEGERWAQVARGQHQERRPLPARRGAIYDRQGIPLALSHETFQLSVATRELSDARAVSESLQRVLGLPPALARRATAAGRRWVVIPGRFSAAQYRALADVPGLHWERRLERFYPRGEVAREVLGTVSRDGRALGGMEQEFDGVLRGEAGYSVLRRDARGRAEATLSLPIVRPTDGSDVHLTLDVGVQEIADAALRSAIANTGASGGDLLIVEPTTGDVLAAVSRRSGRERALSAFTEPYEPGSTLKPFFVATLLAEGHVSLDDTVHGENGSWRTAEGRVITDVHPYGRISVRDALRVSSNVGMAKLAPRLPPPDQFAYLRDFGFGTPTGVAFPAESSGRLTHPARWSRFTPASLAMGYEVAATPLQMVMAYGALANGGVLMSPRLLREVRSADGVIRTRTEPEALRRVIPERVAGELRDVLVSVVDDGTATRASLSTFAVAGKTGTSRRVGPNGRYEAGSYTATFVGYFPARDPQLVIFVKLDQPRGAYYGGLTAAPVTRETLQAILAARSPVLDGAGLLGTRRDGTGAAAPSRPGQPLRGSDGTYVFLLEQGIPAPGDPPPPVTVALPSLEGAPLRDAARRLHTLGVRVRTEGRG